MPKIDEDESALLVDRLRSAYEDVRDALGILRQHAKDGGRTDFGGSRYFTELIPERLEQFIGLNEWSLGWDRRSVKELEKDIVVRAAIDIETGKWGDPMVRAHRLDPALVAPALAAIDRFMELRKDAKGRVSGGVPINRELVDRLRGKRFTVREAAREYYRIQVERGIKPPDPKGRNSTEWTIAALGGVIPDLPRYIVPGTGDRNLYSCIHLDSVLELPQEFPVAFNHLSREAKAARLEELVGSLRPVRVDDVEWTRRYKEACNEAGDSRIDAALGLYRDIRGYGRKMACIDDGPPEPWTEEMIRVSYDGTDDKRKNVVHREYEGWTMRAYDEALAKRNRKRKRTKKKEEA